MLIFETERLIVRQFTEADKGSFFSMSGNVEVMRYIRPVNTKKESDDFLLENIAFYKTNPHRGRWAADDKESGVFVGSFAIIPIPSMPEKIQLGYSFPPENWGKGYATELTRAGLKYFFKTDILNEIYGVTEEPNIVSQKVLQKAGFAPTGHFMEGDKKLLMFVAKRNQF
jgi:ribosomal-protein-alanine N-acetyltransferase